MNPTIAWMTTRGLFGRKRFLLLFPLPLLVIGLAWLSSSAGAPERDITQAIVIALGIAVVLPVISLVVGASVLGSEIDDGTVVHILTKPIPRWQIVVSKLIVAALASAVTVGVTIFVAARFAGDSGFAFGMAAASAIGAIVYSALFVALSVVSRRPVLIGLLYVLVWEGVLSGLIQGTGVLSVRQYVQALALEFTSSPDIGSSVSTRTAVIMTIALTVLAAYFASSRLRSFSVAGETS